MVKYPDDITQAVIKDSLTKGIVELEFQKADETIRKMKATLQESIVPHTVTKKDKKPNTEICIVWDTDLSQWRSFRWDRLKTFKETS
jgi:hypothetical protein|tara:strand:+ start:4275 stop:4535 length:261 start_codon:yes stop_codon:yes gene_type:complete